MKAFRLQGRSFWGFKYALGGLWYVIRNERHFRFHICAAIGTFMFTEHYNFSEFEYALLSIAIILVLSSEIMNTAIEHAVDLCTEEYNEKAKIAKDVSASFVLVCSIFALFAAYILFFEPAVLFPSLLGMFTRIKYIVFFAFTILFVRGIGIKGEKDEK